MGRLHATVLSYSQPKIFTPDRGRDEEQRRGPGGCLLSMEADIAEASDGSLPADWPVTVRSDARAAVAVLFAEHHLALVRLAVVMVGDVETAEDVVQDAFEKLQAGWHRLRDEDSSLAYARSTVLNGCRNVR